METAVGLSVRPGHAPTQRFGLTPRWYLWAVIGLVAVAAHLSFALLTGRLVNPEMWEYESIANHLLQGEGFVFQHFNTLYRSYCEPLYPFMVAGVYAVTRHSQSFLVLMQIALFSMTAMMAGRCAWHLTQDVRVAGLAGLIVAVHPGLILYSTKLAPLVLDTFFFTSVVLTAFFYAERPTVKRSLWMGIASGFCFLTRPTVMVIFPLLTWWIWRSTGESSRVRCARLALMLGVAGAIAAPWVVRNYRVHHQLMLTRSNTPYVFWLGNNPSTTGSALNWKNQDVFSLAPPEFIARIYRSDELTQNRLFGEAAWDYIRSDPIGFFRRTWQKWIYFWWFSPQAGIRYSAKWFALYRFWWGMLAFAGLWGLYAVRTLAPHLRPAFLLVMGAAVAVGIAQSFFYIEGRHRLAVEPLLSGIIAFGVIDLIVQRRRFNEEKLL